MMCTAARLQVPTCIDPNILFFAFHGAARIESGSGLRIDFDCEADSQRVLSCRNNNWSVSYDSMM